MQQVHPFMQLRFICLCSYDSSVVLPVQISIGRASADACAKDATAGGKAAILRSLHCMDLLMKACIMHKGHPTMLQSTGRPLLLCCLHKNACSCAREGRQRPGLLTEPLLTLC